MNQDDGLQENEFNTNVAAKAVDGEIVFWWSKRGKQFLPVCYQQFFEKK